MADNVSKSWFCVFNNPAEHGYQGEPKDIIGRLINEWVGDSLTRTCAMTYCVSADGVDYNNAEKGVIVGMDETQNWFSSAQSKNFPPEMLTVCTQNRKNRRIILGTAQSFYLLAKAIRTQCTEIRECYTFFGCLTVVRRLEPALDFEGNIAELKKKGYYFFVHNKELRESYDTYKCISALSDSGFLNKEELKI